MDRNQSRRTSTDTDKIFIPLQLILSGTASCSGRYRRRLARTHHCAARQVDCCCSWRARVLFIGCPYFAHHLLPFLLMAPAAGTRDGRGGFFAPNRGPSGFCRHQPAVDASQPRDRQSCGVSCQEAHRWQFPT